MSTLTTIADTIEAQLCPTIDALLCLHGAALTHQQKRMLERVESMLEELWKELQEEENEYGSKPELQSVQCQR